VSRVPSVLDFENTAMTLRAEKVMILKNQHFDEDGLLGAYKELKDN